MNDEDDFNIIYATINTLLLNPENKNKLPIYCERCYLERKTKNGEDLIYDVHNGLIINKKLFWKMENPKIRNTKNKESIKKTIELYEIEDYDDLVINNFTTPLNTSDKNKTLNKSNSMFYMLKMMLLELELNDYYNKTNKKL